ncbi:hypothetical protein F511_33279 [Dorcoceras hygrometricum]|uniref:Uncharacterized protein n=1 Tax=Dorcoceras hygrometricum TaxID=472368 RepID=A0A2Z7CU53_9LAMI|nr:hypothetical protein F511_33279 [Dorcoceras hygrometricum]
MHTSRNCVTNYIHMSFTSSCLDGNCVGKVLIHSLNNLAQLTKCASESVSGCPVVGREKLATVFPNDWMRSNNWFIVAHAWEYCCYLLVSLERVPAGFVIANHRLNLTKAKLCRINLFKRIVLLSLSPSTNCWLYCDWILLVRPDLYRSSSILRLFLASVPAGPFAPADLSSSAEHDVVTNDIIIDGPLRCSSWFPFDVPAGSSFLYRLQLVLIVPVDSLCSSWFNLASA